MNCPKCKSKETAKRKKKTKLGYATFFCKSCSVTFNERSGRAGYLGHPVYNRAEINSRKGV